MTKEPIIDSNIMREQALINNPEKPPCPAEILERLQLMTVHYFGFDGKLHRGQILLDEELVGDILEMFELARELKFPFAKVVPISHPDYQWDAQKLVIRDNVTYAFGYRFIADTKILSKHAHGQSIDINPQQNPYIRYRDGEVISYPPKAVWNPEKPGTLHKDHGIVTFMESRGWEWGGDWTPDTGRTDYMHFQKILD